MEYFMGALVVFFLGLVIGSFLAEERLRGGEKCE